MNGRLQDRLALITGASRGIGAALAVEMAREGAHVVLVARDTKGLEATDDAVKKAGGSATLVPMDLTDYAAIDRMAAQIMQRWGRLDALVGNAAMLADLTPVAHTDPDIWDKALAINVTANMRLLRAFDVALRQSTAGRVVFFTSGVTRSAPPYWGYYTASKMALEGLALCYAQEIENTAIRVNLINPGPTRTALRATAFPGEDPADLPDPGHVAEAVIRLCLPDFEGNGLWVAGDTPITDADGGTRH
jgi:NAD(P)-dependent dehydrogenase (short-subunit alcohol dehydrogenase family)